MRGMGAPFQRQIHGVVETVFRAAVPDVIEIRVDR